MKASYYTMKPGSQILAPANRDARKREIASEIYSLFETHRIPSFEATRILDQVKARVIGSQGELDRNYYQRREG